MATQLGEISINSIDGNIIKGTFTSIYEKNVYNANKNFALDLLEESCMVNDTEDSPLMKLSEGDILKVVFETPNQERTNFTITVAPHVDLGALVNGSKWWESYMLG